MTKPRATTGTLVAVLFTGPCETPWDAYSISPAVAVPDMVTTTWEANVAPLQDKAGCPWVLEASGGDQYPMRVAAWTPPCREGDGSSRRFLLSPEAALFVDVEAGPRWGAGDVSALGAIHRGVVGLQPIPCEAGIDEFSTQDGARMSGFEFDYFSQAPLLRHAPVRDLEVVDLWADGTREIIAAGAPGLGACQTCPGSEQALIGLTQPDCDRPGGFTILRQSSAGPGWVGATWLGPVLQTEVAEPGAVSWIRAFDTDSDGDLELLFAISGLGVVRYAPDVDQQPGTVIRTSATPKLCASDPSANPCMLYESAQLSVEADLIRPNPNGPVWLVEALACAAGHTDEGACSTKASASASRPRVTLRDAHTGQRLREWLGDARLVPMSLLVVEGCGIVPGTSCATESRPIVLISGSTREYDPLSVVAQDLTQQATSLHPISDTPRGWYRDVDAWGPFLPPPTAGARPCKSPSPGDATIKVERRVTTLTGAGRTPLIAACVGEAEVPLCAGSAPADPCYSHEPGERYVVWRGSMTDARLVVGQTKPQNVLLTNSFLGQSPILLWHPANKP